MLHRSETLGLGPGHALRVLELDAGLILVVGELYPVAGRLRDANTAGLEQ